ncbi:MAG TPA: N-acetylmuramic acid 6-phosphate etherase [Trebonia sp.]|jgi:N-acetylmuramic acid 6-phosphate etherase|nr:N-acetylmuramic acid 6-phosphate etherase [Trebonia sp.]
MTVSPDEPSVAAAVDFAADLAALPHTEPSAAKLPPTEVRNPRTLDIDALATLDVLRLLNAEDEAVPGAVRALLGALAVVVDEAAARVRRGGRVHYFGAGSSGRIAVLDATELAPTFGMTNDEVVAHLAGGAAAMTRAVEGAEDDTERGGLDAAQAAGPLDVVIGLSASGRTPYVAGALSAAGERGAFTVVVTCDPASPLIALAAVALVPETGPEAIAGSTRMKATTAMKLILNSFSTALMIRLGRTYSNLMVEMSASNSKLRERKVRILEEACGAGRAASEKALAAADGDLRLALVTLVGGVDVGSARNALADGDGSVRGALGALGIASAG